MPQVCSSVAMSNTDKIMLECTSCGRKKRVSREPTDPPGLTLMQTQCHRCNRGRDTPEFYFDAQGQEIDCDGELLIRQMPAKLAMIAPKLAMIGMSIIAVGLLVYSIAF
jgi:hypothetical protein